jgi:hypothetical protein
MRNLGLFVEPDLVLRLTFHGFVEGNHPPIRGAKETADLPVSTTFRQLISGVKFFSSICIYVLFKCV